MNPADAAAAMCADARDFYRFGWMLGTSGNLSVRVDDASFLISASGKDKGRLSADDFLTCGFDGSPLEETALRPSAETLIHCAIYVERPQVGAVYHVHDPYAALCSARDRDSGGTVFRDLEMIKGLDIWDEARVEVPILPNHFDIPTIAEDVRGVLQTSGSRAPGVNIFNHGIYAWGRTAREARRHVETFGYLFRHSWEAGRGA